MANTLGEIFDELRTNPRIEKWEYMTTYISEYSQFNELGKEGWEFCGIDRAGVYIFKRKIQQG